MDDYAYCAEQVRGYDSDRYVTALFAPASRRSDLLALYAFNLELARSRESVSEPTLGQIRLQWWRDVIDECYRGTARRHQVVQPLAAAIERHGLSRHYFEAIIDAREQDHARMPAEDIAELLDYTRKTAGALNRLAFEVLDVRAGEAQDAAEVVGTAWALTGISRGLRHLLITGRHPLPQELMARHGLSHDALHSLRPSNELRAAVAELARIAEETLEQLELRMPSRASPVLLMTVLARAYLRRLAATGHNPFDERNAEPLRYRAWRLLRPALTGRV